MKNNWFKAYYNSFINDVEMGYTPDEIDKFINNDDEFIDTASAGVDSKLKRSTRRMKSRNAIARRRNFFKSIWSPDIFERWPEYDHRVRSCTSPCNWKRDRHELEALYDRKVKKTLNRQMHHILDEIDDVDVAVA